MVKVNRIKNVAQTFMCSDIVRQTSSVESDNKYLNFKNHIDRIDLPHDPAILLLSIHLKVTPSHHKDSCSAILIVALFIIVRNQKQPRCP